jgi:hypothetical protein
MFFGNNYAPDFLQQRFHLMGLDSHQYKPAFFDSSSVIGSNPDVLLLKVVEELNLSACNNEVVCLEMSGCQQSGCQGIARFPPPRIAIRKWFVIFGWINGRKTDYGSC